MDDNLNSTPNPPEAKPIIPNAVEPKKNQEQATQEHAQNLSEPKKNYHPILWFTLLIATLAIAWVLYWFLFLQYHERTDDAYANGNMISINSVIGGSVVAFFADDTDLVMQGQLLVLLDRTNYQISYEKELDTLASIVLQVRQLYTNVNVNKALVEERRVALDRAKYDYENRKKLIESKAVSNEEYTHSLEDFESAEFQYQQAQAQLQVSIDAAGNTPIAKHPQIEQQKAIIRGAFYNLQHTSIHSPATGYIAQRTVQVGQWVSPNEDLMAVIPLDYVWVDANYKETQLTYMRVGQPATVWFDLYGSKVEYTGKVIGIGFGSGSVFSLIPPQNATGNWIKIVQRLPVRISLDPEQVKKFPVRLGISAEVDVDITNQNLPMIAKIPHTNAVGSTYVFDIDLNEVDRVMDEIVRKSLSD